MERPVYGNGSSSDRFAESRSQDLGSLGSRDMVVTLNRNPAIDRKKL